MFEYAAVLPDAVEGESESATVCAYLQMWMARLD